MFCLVILYQLVCIFGSIDDILEIFTSSWSCIYKKKENSSNGQKCKKNWQMIANIVIKSASLFMKKKKMMCQHQRSDWWFSLSRDEMNRGLYVGDQCGKLLLANFYSNNTERFGTFVKRGITSWGWAGPSSAQAGTGLYFNYR